MTRAELKTFAAKLTALASNATSLDTFVDDVFNELQIRDDAQMVKNLSKLVTAGTATYAYESDMLRIVEALYDDELLSETLKEAISAYDVGWIDNSGTPVAITQDETDARNYTLFPKPDTTETKLHLIYADDRSTDILDIFALPISLDALRREFAYPSAHADLEAAKNYDNLAKLFYALLGYK